VWGAPHDALGLMGLFGGQGPFVSKLGELFELGRADWEATDPKAPLSSAAPRPYYWAGNEPDIHAAYLFAQWAPELTARWVRWAMDTFYGDGADGLPGNDDGGRCRRGTCGARWGSTRSRAATATSWARRASRGCASRCLAGADHRGGGISKENTAVTRVELDGAPVSGPEVRQGTCAPGGRCAS